MKSFQQYLLEQNTESPDHPHFVSKPPDFVSEGSVGVVPKLPKLPETLQRQIFHQAPNPIDSYNQIVTRHQSKANFSWKTSDGKIDPIVQASWADPRKGLPIDDDDKAWDFSYVGSANKAEVKARSPFNQAGYTSKRFYSLKGSENLDTLKRFSAAIPDFHQRMGSLADQFKTGFSYKVPHHPSVAASHTDTLVVHHYDVPDSSLSRSIDATTRQWAQDHGIEFLNRGCNQGVDCKVEGSHTLRVANQINRGAKGSLARISKEIINNSLLNFANRSRQQTQKLTEHLRTKILCKLQEAKIGDIELGPSSLSALDTMVRLTGSESGLPGGMERARRGKLASIYSDNSLVGAWKNGANSLMRAMTMDSPNMANRVRGAIFNFVERATQHPNYENLRYPMLLPEHPLFGMTREEVIQDHTENIKRHDHLLHVFHVKSKIGNLTDTDLENINRLKENKKLHELGIHHAMGTGSHPHEVDIGKMPPDPDDPQDQYGQLT